MEEGSSLDIPDEFGTSFDYHQQGEGVEGPLALPYKRYQRASLAPWLTGLILALVVFVILIPAFCSACYHYYSYKHGFPGEDDSEADELEYEDELDGDDEDEDDDECCPLCCSQDHHNNPALLFHSEGKGGSSFGSGSGGLKLKIPARLSSCCSTGGGDSRGGDRGKRGSSVSRRFSRSHTDLVQVSANTPKSGTGGSIPSGLPDAAQYTGHLLARTPSITFGLGNSTSRQRFTPPPLQLHPGIKPFAGSGTNCASADDLGLVGNSNSKGMKVRLFKPSSEVGVPPHLRTGGPPIDSFTSSSLQTSSGSDSRNRQISQSIGGGRTPSPPLPPLPSATINGGNFYQRQVSSFSEGGGVEARNRKLSLAVTTPSCLCPKHGGTSVVDGTSTAVALTRDNETQTLVTALVPSTSKQNRFVRKKSETCKIANNVAEMRKPSSKKNWCWRNHHYEHCVVKQTHHQQSGHKNRNCKPDKFEVMCETPISASTQKEHQRCHIKDKYSAANEESYDF